MALEDTRLFLEDLLFRYDPDVDLTDGARAQTDLINPILSRIGSDPFDEDISTFITERIRQVYPDLAITEDDALQDTIIDPMRVIIEPIVREVKLIKLRASLRNIESLSDDEVDGLMSNFFESRLSGGFAIGSVRLYFSVAQSVSLSLLSPATTRAGLRFFPSRPQAITADQMLLNVEGTEFYFDVNYTSENRGDEYNVEANTITSIANIPTATRVANLRRFRKGVARENSLTFAARAEASISDKTLTVQRGIIRTISEAFPAVRGLFTVGFRDPEMRRDIIKGGALGSVPADDSLGAYYGTGTPTDDFNGDATTLNLVASTGNFVSRVGAVGTLPVPYTWYITLTYDDSGTTIFVDVPILFVVSGTEIIVDHEMPIALATGAVTWALRRRTLTISDIPGGITLPDSAEGVLELVADEVHIGGKTDIYIAGETEAVSAQITGLTDEQPVARGADGRTAGTATVVLYDPTFVAAVDAGTVVLETGWSLVLEEGVDAGSYALLAFVATLTEVTLTLDQTMTGTQANLSWRVVDDITTELTDPKDIKLTGGDAVTVAGGATVTTLSSANFIDANVQADDILRLNGDSGVEGDYTITEVSAVTIEVDPVPPRTVSAVSYSVFRRSEAVSPPLVRITSLELLDSGGAPVGTVIPYRDPVLSSSRAFQNEGSALSFDDLGIVGLTTAAEPVGFFVVNGLTLDWEVYDKDAAWAVPLATGTFTFSGGPHDAAAVAALVGADAALIAAGVSTSAFVYGADIFAGIICANFLRFTSSSTALTALGLDPFITNASFRPLAVGGTMPAVRQGDVFEVIDGVNYGRTGRVLQELNISGIGDVVNGGSGPFGPDNIGYAFTPLVPEAGVRVQVGRPSVGSARTYFISPTSAEFSYNEATFTTEGATRTLTYVPDPENKRVLRPAPPATVLPAEGVTSNGPDQLTDADANFLVLNIKPGDLLELLYQPIDGVSIGATLALTGLDLVLRLDTDPFITISFPFAMTRQAAADYINTQVGEDIASIVVDALRLQPASRRLEVSFGTAATLLGLSALPLNNEHAQKGTYVIAAVPSTTVLTLAASTPLAVGAVADSQYRVRRYIQRISSTEMDAQQDAAGLYYVDVELLSLAPGNDFNIEAAVTLAVAGHKSDGYNLSVENSVLSFSRAEVLFAEISRTILLVGSADSPEEYVQLSQQNVQVNYDRSQLVDEAQSFVDADTERVVCEEILVRHLLPHYASVDWKYMGGSAEPAMVRALTEALDAVEPNTQLEVLDLVKTLTSKGATSVYTLDEDAATGRRAALVVLLVHDVDRKIQGVLVQDFAEITRLQRYIPDTLTLKRISPGGIR